MEHAPVAAQGHHVCTADGTSLYVQDYLLPRAEVQGSIVLMHGLGEHCGRYQHVARFFNDCGLSVRCYDHRGHGRSEGRRGDVPNGDPMLQDAEIIIDDFAAHFPDPPFLFGHSMGGLFAARFALSRRSALRGLVLSSPALAVNLSRVQMMLLNIMSAVAPHLGVPNGLSPQFLSHDPAVVAAYENDPLVHGKISSRLLRSMLESIEFCQERACTLSPPTLMLVAGDDRLVDASGSKAFLARVPPALAKMHFYPHCYHELLNELDARQPFSDLRAWLGSVLSSPLPEPAQTQHM